MQGDQAIQSGSLENKFSTILHNLPPIQICNPGYWANSSEFYNVKSVLWLANSQNNIRVGLFIYISHL